MRSFWIRVGLKSKDKCQDIDEETTLKRRPYQGRVWIGAYRDKRAQKPNGRT